MLLLSSFPAASLCMQGCLLTTRGDQGATLNLGEITSVTKTQGHKTVQKCHEEKRVGLKLCEQRMALANPGRLLERSSFSPRPALTSLSSQCIWVVSFLSSFFLSLPYGVAVGVAFSVLVVVFQTQL